MYIIGLKTQPIEFIARVNELNLMVLETWELEILSYKTQQNRFEVRIQKYYENYKIV